MFYLTSAGSFNQDDEYVEAVGICDWQNTDIATSAFATEAEAEAALAQRRALSKSVGAQVEDGEGGYYATFTEPQYAALVNATAVYPESSDFRDGADASGHWYEEANGKIVKVEQVVGQSGVYLIETDSETGEVIRDGRPWQMHS